MRRNHTGVCNLIALGMVLGLIPSLSRDAAAADPVAMPATMTVEPAKLRLTHPRQPFLLQVLGNSADGFAVDLFGQAKIVSADVKIARVDGFGRVHPVSNGQTKISVTALGQTRVIPVEVKLPADRPDFSFRHEVMPVLSRAGCNMGACHGYSLGKNGFRLSLRGGDAEQDYASIVREYSSRRLDFLHPANSILVTKPRGEVAHEGGVRFAKDSLLDKILTGWIADGAPSDLVDKKKLVGVRLIPDRLILVPGQRHRLQLVADYDDGSTREVTQLGVLEANNTLYADVDGAGVVTAGYTGETAIVARYERKFAATGVMVVEPKPGFTPTAVPTNHFVDRHVIEKLNRLKITPSPLADDEEFLRRVYLDMIGIQPTPTEIRAFLASKEVSKRDKVIDGLFERPEFVDHWSLKWGDLLQNSRNTVSPQSVYLFREFIRGAVASNMPMDQFSRKILTARGGSVDDPASVYFAISKDTNDTLERVTQVFCGVRMLCARCHTHPMENWTQADYYGLASFFSQVTVRNDGRFPNVRDQKLVALNLAAPSAVNPRTGSRQPPRVLGGEDLKLPTDVDRRQAYADWLVTAKNPFFARGLVNRYWSYFFHRGIIDPVDDIRSTNPPINPALLDALTQDFIDHKFDVRHLIRRIVTSATYQRSSKATASNKDDEQNFSHAIARRVPAEALLDCFIQATAVPQNFPGVPGGFRAAQLPDGEVNNEFLKLFGKAQRMEACECERDNSSNMLQALHFINSKDIHDRLKNPGGRVALLLRNKIDDKQLVEELYLWSLARRPSAEESAVCIRFLNIANYKNKRAEAAQDLLWALLNSRDFLLVH